MKYKLIFLSLFSILILIAASCKKEKQPVGKTFSCKIDGVIFKPSESTGLFGSNPILVDNLLIDGFIIQASKFGNSTTFTTVITLRLPHLINPGTYNLDNYPRKGMYEIDYSNGPIYETNGSHIGSLTISRCDTVNQSYSGTFYFTAIDKNTGKVVNVTDGIFDVKR
jgi:hypothetical protein